MPSKRLFWPLSGLLGLSLSTLSSGAWGLPAPAPTEDQVTAARDLFRSAERDEDGQLWPEALAKLRQVAAIKLTPGVRYHVALCEEHVGQLASALSDYKEAERQARAEGARDVLDLVGMRILDVSARVPRLTIRVAPEGTIAAVTLDGERVALALLGTAMAVDAGQHRVQASSPDHEPSASMVTLLEHESADVVLSLEPAVPPAIRPEDASPAAGIDRTRQPRGNGTVVLLAGLGALGLVTGGVGAFVAAGNKVEDGVRACQKVVSPVPDACDSLKNTVREWDWIAAAAWAGAAASVTIAIVAWTKNNANLQPSSPAARLLVGPGSLGVAGTF